MKCPVCQSSNCRIIYKQVDGFNIDREFDIMQCINCSTAFTYPLLSTSERKRYYSKQILAFSGAGGDDLINDYKKISKNIGEN